jgi:hypothetical protein
LIRSKILKRRKGKIGARHPGFIAIPDAVVAVNYVWTVFRTPLEHNQLLGVLDRQRPQQDGVHEAVYRGVCPDAQRQRQCGHGGE